MINREQLSDGGHARSSALGPAASEQFVTYRAIRNTQESAYPKDVMVMVQWATGAPHKALHDMKIMELVLHEVRCSGRRWDEVCAWVGSC